MARRRDIGRVVLPGAGSRRVVLGEWNSADKPPTAPPRFLASIHDDDVRALYKGKPHEGHKENFFRCIAEGGLPVSDVYSHIQAMDTCHLCSIAARLNREIHWDPATRTSISKGVSSRGWLTTLVRTRPTCSCWTSVRTRALPSQKSSW